MDDADPPTFAAVFHCPGHIQAIGLDRGLSDSCWIQAWIKFPRDLGNIRWP